MNISRLGVSIAFVLALLSGSSEGFAAAPVNALREGPYAFLADAVMLNRDEGKKIDFNLEHKGLALPPVGYMSDALWLRFRLKNEASLSTTAVVHPQGLFPSSFLYGVYTKDGRRLRTGEGGLNSRFSQREKQSFQAYFMVEIPPGEERIIQMRLTQDGMMDPHVKIVDRASWEKIDRNYTLFMGIVMGGCITLLVYSFFAYLRLRDSVLATYLALLFSNLLAIAYWNGAHAGWVEAYPNGIIALFPAIPRLAGLCACLFSISLVRLPRRRPLLNSFLSGLMAMTVSTILLQAFWPAFFSRLGDLCHALLLVLSLGILLEKVWDEVDWHFLLMSLGVAASGIATLSLVAKVYVLGELSDLSNISWSYAIGTFLVSVGLITRMQFKRDVVQVVLREASDEQAAEIDRLSREIDAHKDLCRVLELKISEKQQMESNGVKAIGEVSASVAEEMQSALHSVVSLAKTSLIETQNEAGTDMQVNLERILRTSMRAENVMRNLRRAANPEVGTESLLMNDFVRDCIELCQDRLLKAGIEIEVKFLAEDAAVNGCFADLLQVFLAMIANSCDAMANLDLRKITLQLSRFEGSDGEWLQMQFSDSGLGVPTIMKQNIFKPFYSSKSAHGGLGLARATTIVKNHGGQIWLDPDAVATTFVLRLPLSRKHDKERIAS